MDKNTSHLIQMKDYTVKIAANMEWAIWGGLFTWFLETFLQFTIPIRKFLLLTLVLVVSDSITGIIKARRKKQRVHSGGLRRTFSKIGVYFIAIMTGHHLAAVFFPAIPIAYTISLAICLTEFKSIIENVEEINGAPIWKFIQDKFKNLIHTK